MGLQRGCITGRSPKVHVCVYVCACVCECVCVCVQCMCMCTEICMCMCGWKISQGAHCSHVASAVGRHGRRTHGPAPHRKVMRVRKPKTEGTPYERKRAQIVGQGTDLCGLLLYILHSALYARTCAASTLQYTRTGLCGPLLYTLFVRTCAASTCPSLDLAGVYFVLYTLYFTRTDLCGLDLPKPRPGRGLRQNAATPAVRTRWGTVRASLCEAWMMTAPKAWELK